MQVPRRNLGRAPPPQAPSRYKHRHSSTPKSIPATPHTRLRFLKSSHWNLLPTRSKPGHRQANSATKHQLPDREHAQACRLQLVGFLTSHNMAPLTAASDDKTHQALLDKLDIYAVPKPFRNPNWKPPQRRNKNLKQILGEASRKEASVMATQNNSGNSTPAVATEGNVGRQPNIAQAAQSLSTLVLEKNGRAAAGPAPTYTNIESAPSFHPSSQKKYCDITGLPAPYTDPKTRLRYHNKEVFGGIRTMPQNVSEGYLAARGAHTILK
jgi:INO80 complex subunit C